MKKRRAAKKWLRGAPEAKHPKKVSTGTTDEVLLSGEAREAVALAEKVLFSDEVREDVREGVAEEVLLPGEVREEVRENEVGEEVREEVREEEVGGGDEGGGQGGGGGGGEEGDEKEKKEEAGEEGGVAIVPIEYDRLIMSVEEGKDLHEACVCDIEVKERHLMKKVRVVEEDPLHIAHYGMRGQVTGLVPEKKSVLVKFEGVTFLAPVELPLRILKIPLDTETPPLKIKTVDKMTNEMKLGMLIRCGVRDPFTQHPDGPQPGEKTLSPTSIDAWVRVFRLSMKDTLPGRVSVVESTLVQMIVLVALKDESGPFGLRCADLQESHELRCRYLRNEFFKHEVLIVPIFMSGHFTCMSVWRREEGLRRVRYFETLNTPSAACLRAAQVVLSTLGLAEVVMLRLNAKRQTACECGLMALHYVESETRRARSENLAVMGLPTEGRLKHLMSVIVSLFKAMKKEHEKWLLRKERSATTLSDMRARFERRLEKILMGKATTDEAAMLALERAKNSLNENANAFEDPPPLMTGIEVDPPAEKLEKAEKAEKATIDVEGGFSIEILSSFGGEPPKKASKKADEAGMSAEAGRKAGSKADEAGSKAADLSTKADEIKSTDTGSKADETKSTETSTKASEIEMNKIRAIEALSVSKRAFEKLTDELVSEGTLTADILRPAFLKEYEKVLENGAGVCPRCDWQYGCLSCDPFKALRYWVRQELKRPEEDVRPRAKGRPKSAR